MLTINLLPDALRKVPFSPIEQFHRSPLMWLIAVAMVVYPPILWAPLQINRGQLEQLSQKVQRLQPTRVEMDRLHQSMQQLRAREAALRQVQQKQSLWSRRLQTLSAVTPDGVWYNELMLDPTKGLLIQGSVLGQGGDEMVGVGRLVQDLKADADFTAPFKDVQIESIKRIYEGDLEVVQFNVNCAFREPAGTVR